MICLQHYPSDVNCFGCGDARRARGAACRTTDDDQDGLPTDREIYELWTDPYAFDTDGGKEATARRSPPAATRRTRRTIFRSKAA
jgi:hypothetical protein